MRMISPERRKHMATQKKDFCFCPVDVGRAAWHEGACLGLPQPLELSQVKSRLGFIGRREMPGGLAPQSVLVRAWSHAACLLCMVMAVVCGPGMHPAPWLCPLSCYLSSWGAGPVATRLRAGVQATLSLSRDRALSLTCIVSCHRGHVLSYFEEWKSFWASLLPMFALKL